MTDNTTQQQLDFLTHPEKLEEVSKRGMFKWGRKISYLFPLFACIPFGFTLVFDDRIGILFMAGGFVALFCGSVLGVIMMSLSTRIKKSIGMKGGGDIFEKPTAEYKLEVVGKLEKNQALLEPALYSSLLQVLAQKPATKLWWASLDNYLKNVIEVHRDTNCKKEWMAKSVALQKEISTTNLSSPIGALLSTDKDGVF